MLISIDLSLRSIGIVALKEDGELSDFKIIGSSTGVIKSNLPIYNNENLLIYNANEISKFIEYKMTRNAIDAVVIEGLAFNSLSSGKDILFGNFWHTRCHLKKKFPKMLIGIVPVKSWRNWATTKEERRIAIEKHGKKEHLKKMVVDKLPKEIKLRFNKYIKKENLPAKAIYDLADAYFLGIYRLTLDK